MLTALHIALYRAVKPHFLASLYGGRPQATPTEALVTERLLRHRPRISRDQQRGWSTKISFRTYNSLKNQGILD